MAYVRRRSSAFSRGRSRFRGVSGHAGRWEARIGSFGGRKNVSAVLSDHGLEAGIGGAWAGEEHGAAAELPARGCAWLDPSCPRLPSPALLPHTHPPPQVSFGVFETEEDAARQYDRALILEKVGSGVGSDNACGQGVLRVASAAAQAATTPPPCTHPPAHASPGGRAAPPRPTSLCATTSGRWRSTRPTWRPRERSLPVCRQLGGPGLRA